jgi:hypothetical protein
MSNGNQVLVSPHNHQQDPSEKNKILPSLTWQLKRLRQFNALYKLGITDDAFSDINIPDPNFNLNGKELMIDVQLPKVENKSSLQRTFDVFWKIISAPDGYRKERPLWLNSGPKQLKLAEGIEHDPDIEKPIVRVIVIDLKANFNADVDLLKKANTGNLAYSQVLLAAALSPSWVYSTVGSAQPIMAGYRFGAGNNLFEDLPCFHCCRKDCSLTLGTYMNHNLQIDHVLPEFEVVSTRKLVP